MLVLVEIGAVGVAGRRGRTAYVAEPTRSDAEPGSGAAVARRTAPTPLDDVAGETIQLHGGIAITWEHDAHLVFKRAHALGQLFGPGARSTGRRSPSGSTRRPVAGWPGGCSTAQPLASSAPTNW